MMRAPTTSLRCESRRLRAVIAERSRLDAGRIAPENREGAKDAKDAKGAKDQGIQVRNPEFERGTKDGESCGVM